MNENSHTPEPQQTSSSGPSVIQPLPGETPEAFEALMLYSDSNQKMTYPKIAVALGVHPNTVSNWASKFHWRARIMAHRAQHFSYKQRAEAAVRQQETLAQIEIIHMVKDSKIRNFRKFDAVTDTFLDEYLAKGLQNLRLGEFTQFCSLHNRIGDSLLPPSKSQQAATESQLKAADARYFEEVSKAWPTAEQPPAPTPAPQEPPQDPPGT